MQGAEEGTGTLGGLVSTVTAVLRRLRCCEGEREVGFLFRLWNPQWCEARGRQSVNRHGEEFHEQLEQSKDGVCCSWVSRCLSLEAFEPRRGGQSVPAPLRRGGAGSH